jgi:uncharacterized protein (TIGR00251 family)
MSEKLYRIRVIPNSKVNKIIEKAYDFLKIKLTAPSHEGKANKALIEFLSREFKLPKSKIQIVSGLKTRDKKITIES